MPSKNPKTKTNKNKQKQKKNKQQTKKQGRKKSVKMSSRSAVRYNNTADLSLASTYGVVSEKMTPRFVPASRGGCRLTSSGSQYLTTIKSGGGSYVNNRFEINPGLPEVFPWLANVAKNFEMYVIHKLVFSLSTVTNTDAQGKVVCYFDYDPHDAGASDYKSAALMDGSTRYPPWSPGVRSFVPDKRMMDKEGRLMRYVRLGPIVGGELSAYDPGTFNVGVQKAVNNMAAAAPEDEGDDWMELEVAYDIEFNTPGLNKDLTQSITLVG